MLHIWLLCPYFPGAVYLRSPSLRARVPTALRSTKASWKFREFIWYLTNFCFCYLWMLFKKVEARRDPRALAAPATSLSLLTGLAQLSKPSLEGGKG